MFHLRKYIIFQFIFYFFFLFLAIPCGILVLQPRMEPRPPAVGAQGLSPWTVREAPCFWTLILTTRSLSPWPSSQLCLPSSCDVMPSGWCPTTPWHFHVQPLAPVLLDTPDILARPGAPPTSCCLATLTLHVRIWISSQCPGLDAKHTAIFSQETVVTIMASSL